MTTRCQTRRRVFLKTFLRLGLFTAGLDGGNVSQVIGQARGIEGLDIHLDKGNERTTEIGELAAAAVHDRSCGDDDAAVVTDDLYGLLNPASARDDILGDEETLAGLDLKTTAEDESAGAVFFNEDVFFSQMARDFLADNDSADGRGDDSRRLESAQLFGKESADMGGHSGILQKKRALEKLAAMQSAAEDEMSVKKRAGFSEEIEDFVHQKILFFVFVDPLDEGLHTASAVADLAGEFFALVIEENEGGEAVDMEFFGQSLVGGLGFGALLGAAWKIDFHRHEVGFGEFLEGWLGKDILRQFFAWRAPVRTGELEKNEAILGGGLLEGFVEVCAPEFGGVKRNNPQEDQGENYMFHGKIMDAPEGESKAKNS